MSDPVAIVIVNWNGLEHLRTCIPAVLAQDHALEAIVVDNGSTDESVAWLRSTYPQVRLVCNEANHGFARATNQGILLSDATYLGLLNNDARPEPGWLAAMVDALESGRRVGMAACQIRFAHRPDLLDSAGIEVDTLGVGWNRHFGMPVAREPEEIKEVLGPCGAAALYRREMLDEIGLFDERYFAYYEDVDLAWRAQRAGWRCLYTPRARVLHLHSATGRQGSAFKAYHLNRNRIWTFVKHYSLRRFLLWWPLILLFDASTWLVPLAQGRTAALRGHLDALRGWRWAWQERRRLGAWRNEVSLALPRFRTLRMPTED